MNFFLMLHELTAAKFLISKMHVHTLPKRNAQEMLVYKRTESKFCNDMLRFPYYQAWILNDEIWNAINRNCCENKNINIVQLVFQESGKHFARLYSCSFVCVMCVNKITLSYELNFALVSCRTIFTYTFIRHCYRKIAVRRLEGWEPIYVVAQRYNVYRSTLSRLWKRYLQTGTSNELVVRTVHLCNRSGIYVFSIYATGQLLQAYQVLVFAEYPNKYPNKQCVIPCEKADCEPDYLILVPFWWYSIVVHGSGGRNTVRNWTLWNWRRIWFSDESRFML